MYEYEGKQKACHAILQLPMTRSGIRLRRSLEIPNWARVEQINDQWEPKKDLIQ